MQDFAQFAERERAGWADEGIVSAYVAKFGPVTDHIASYLVDRISPGDQAVLDLCCGQGNLSALLVAAGADVKGLDFSDEMLALAARNAPRAEFRQGDAAALPFGDACFDQVICNFGMMHLPDQPAALREVHRVLRPGGTFLMSTWASPDVSPAFGTIFRAIKAHADLSQAPAQPDLFVFADPGGAKEMMSPCGFKLVSHELVPAFWEFSEPEDLFEIFLTATVAVSQLMKGQNAEVVTAIREQVTQTVQDTFREGEEYRVPVAVTVVEARKGSS